jgi:hypothetical protein
MREKDLDSVVREQLLIIDDHLLRADRTWGNNVVAYELPTTFSFPGIPKSDTQRIVYSSIISSLQERGFTTQISLNSDKTIIYIKWGINIDFESINAMDRLIESVRIKETPPQHPTPQRSSRVADDRIPSRRSKKTF